MGGSTKCRVRFWVSKRFCLELGGASWSQTLKPVSPVPCARLKLKRTHFEHAYDHHDNQVYPHASTMLSVTLEILLHCY